MGTGARPGWDRGLCLVWGALQGRASSGVGVESPPAPKAQRKEWRADSSLVHMRWSLQPGEHLQGKHTHSRTLQASIQTPLETSPPLVLPPQGSDLV